jgi:hypothetical protein
VKFSSLSPSGETFHSICFFKNAPRAICRVSLATISRQNEKNREKRKKQEKKFHVCFKESKKAKKGKGKELEKD